MPMVCLKDDCFCSRESCDEYDICKERKLQEQTNEEYIRSCNTRKLAKELSRLVLYDMPLFDRLHNVFEGEESRVIDECEKWLREKCK